MDKQIFASSHNGILLNNEKEWTTETYNNTGRSQKHYV